jgi:hypothetical protein
MAGFEVSWLLAVLLGQPVSQHNTHAVAWRRLGNNMSLGTWTVNATQPQLNEKYGEIGKAVVLASNTGGSIDYTLPEGGKLDLLYMGLRAATKKPGFDQTVHIRQKKDDKGDKVPSVFTIWVTWTPAVPA